MRVWDFLIEDYKTTAVKFVASGIDKAQVDVYINKFRELSNKQKLAGEEKNIDFWSKKTFSEFKEFVDVKEKEVTDAANQKAQKKNPGKSEDITTPEQRSAGWNIIIPLDKAASVFYGNLDCMSDWCVAKPEHDYFNEYFYEKNSNLIFCLNDKKEKWAIEIKSDGSTIIFWDIKDDQISKSEFEKQTQLNFDDILRSYKPFIEKIKAFKQSYFDKISLAKLVKLQSLFPDATLETWHVHPNGKGWVQNTASVSASVLVGPNAIVSGNAQVSDHAEVSDHALVSGHAQVSGSVWVGGNARVFGAARVWGDARVFGNAQVGGDARVFDDAEVSGDARVSGNAVVYGNARVFENAQVRGSAQVFGNAKVFDKADVYGSARVRENAEVYGNAQVGGEAQVSGYAEVFGNAKVSGNTKVSGNEMLD